MENLDEEYHAAPVYRSGCRKFLASKVNAALGVTTISLIITLGFVLGFVTVPRFEDDKKQPPRTNEPLDQDLTRYAVVKENFPDPTIVYDFQHDTGWYAFATRNSKVHVQMATSRNVSTWVYHDGYDALPTLGRWVATQMEDPAVWAPSVTNRLDGRWILYYSALARNHTRKHCVGAAISDNIEGPYLPFDDAIVCDFEGGGVIDPAYFHDPMTNTSYLVYKQDGNAIGVGGACDNGNWPNSPTPLMAVELDVASLTRLVSTPFVLLDNIRSDGANIESPVVWYYDYRPADLSNITQENSILSYHLSYNSGCFAHDDYRIQHIICVPAPETGIRDCQWNQVREGNISAGTLLQTGSPHLNTNLIAPGGPAISTSTQGGVGGGNFGKGYMAFHADTNMKWFEDPENTERIRSMFIIKLEYSGQGDMLDVIGLVDPEGTKELDWGWSGEQTYYGV